MFYKIAIKSRFGNYQTIKKEFNNRRHFENWYDLMTNKGHKIIGIYED